MAHDKPKGVTATSQESDEANIPANEFAENIYIFLYLFYLCGLLNVKDCEGGKGCPVIEVVSAWLKEATNEDDFKECVSIFQEFLIV